MAEPLLEARVPERLVSTGVLVDVAPASVLPYDERLRGDLLQTLVPKDPVDVLPLAQPLLQHADQHRWISRDIRVGLGRGLDREDPSSGLGHREGVQATTEVED